MSERQPAFPKRFLWGAATAAHQVEGNTHNQWSVWELENARSLAAQAEYHYNDFPSWERVKERAKDPHNYVSGMAADHYNRYREDFGYLEKMNMNAYRFGIEWARVEPEEGSWDPEAIAHYKEYVRELKRRDIEPIVTLFHFTTPVWFEKKGGFEKRSNVKYFVRYAEKIVSELGLDISKIITINEPEVFVGTGYVLQLWPPAERNVLKAFWVLNNLISAHKRAAKVVRRINRKYKVSVAKHSIYFYPGDNAWLSRVTAAICQYIFDDYYLKRVVKHCDFLGVNYYQSMRTYGYRIHNPETPVNDLNWVMSPADIEFVLERLWAKYKLPILITENGLADETDEHREWWIRETITAMRSAMNRGVRLEGYLHWSLLDNFEWAFGKWPRFGLVEVDYKTQKRTLRPSAIWFGKVIKKLRNV